MQNDIYIPQLPLNKFSICLWRYRNGRVDGLVFQCCVDGISLSTNIGLTGALLYQGGWLAEFGGSVGFRLLKFLEDYVKGTRGKKIAQSFLFTAKIVTKYSSELFFFGISTVVRKCLKAF